MTAFNKERRVLSTKGDILLPYRVAKILVLQNNSYSGSVPPFPFTSLGSFFFSSSAFADAMVTISE